MPAGDFVRADGAARDPQSEDSETARVPPGRRAWNLFGSSLGAMGGAGYVPDYRLRQRAQGDEDRERMPRLMREQTARDVRFCLSEIIDYEVRASCRVHGHCVAESDAAQGILKREAHKLRFRIAQACRPARRTLGADHLPTVLDMRQMLLRDSEHFGKLSLRQGLSLPDGPEELGERERAAAQVLEEGHCVGAAALTTRVLFFSRHGVSPLQPTQVGLRRRRESHK